MKLSEHPLDKILTFKKGARVNCFYNFVISVLVIQQISAERSKDVLLFNNA